jgi:hypothetical protein
MDRVVVEGPACPAILEQREERFDVLDPLKGPGFDVVFRQGVAILASSVRGTMA